MIFQFALPGVPGSFRMDDQSPLTDRIADWLRGRLRSFEPYSRARFEARRCGQYMRSLGRFKGLLIFRDCHIFIRPSGSLMRIGIPSSQSPLLIRKGTTDVKVFEQVYVDRLHEVESVVDPQLIVDGGAHIGCVTVFLAQKFPRATILAIEPDAANFELLRRNVAAYSNVTPIRAALWSQPAVLAVRNPNAPSWEFQMHPASRGDSDKVLGLSVAEILKWTEASRIDLLKLDIEGAERELFAVPGCEAWIERVRQLHIELHDRMIPGCREAVELATRPYRFSESISGEYLVMRRVE